jgi:hypothetical protein
MRTETEIMADAADQRPFSNHTEYEIFAGSGEGCYDCVHDDPETDKFCPILTVSLIGSDGRPAWPREWTRATHRWQVGDASGSYEVVDSCAEFEERPEWGGDDPDDMPEPDPEPPPVCEGQVDMFQVWAEQITEHVESAVPA